MVTDSAAIIMFAIRSAVKLGQQARLAYVDSTRRRQLILPLPNFQTQTNEVDAVDFFKNGSGNKYMTGYISIDGQQIEADEALVAAVKRYDPFLPNPELNRVLIDYHTKYRFVNQASEGSSGNESHVVSADAALTLLTVQQWRRGDDPTPSTLRRMGGTIIEIGIDYALTQPDLFDPSSAKGKAIKGFLNGLNSFDFKEGEIAELPARLFTAAIDVIAENPELLGGDDKIQELVKATTVGISNNVKARLDQISKSTKLKSDEKRAARLDLQDWAQLVFRSTLSTGGRMVVEDPRKYLGVKGTDKQSLVSSVGGAVLDTILDDTIGLRGLLSRKGVETIMQAALKTIGEHPEILTATNNQGLKNIISGLATELSTTSGLLSKDILPELLRLTLEKSGENLNLFWPDLENHPEKNLLISAAATTLKILGAKPTSGKWRLELTKQDLLTVTNTTLDEFLKNPTWLLDDAGEVSDVLKDVLDATVKVLRKRADNRLSAPVAVEIIQASIKAVALRQEFVNKLPNGKPIVAAAIDAVMAAIFKPSNDAKVSWQLLRSEAITGLTEASLEALAKSGLGPETIQKLKATLSNQIAELKKGNLLDVDQFSNSLIAAVSA